MLFLPPVDTANLNAQSLNVREIALRLDPERFQTTLWCEHDPDPRLRGKDWIHIKRLPEHRRTVHILAEMISGYDVIAYMDYSPASYIFVRLPRMLRGGAKAVLHAEGIQELANTSRMFRFLYRGVCARCDSYTGITQFVAEDVHKKLGKKVCHILPVGVDTNFFTPPRARQNAVPVILFAGAVVERKGPQFVLDAASRFPDARFRIVGAARESFDEVLRQKIVQLDLQNVTLEGPKTQAELREIMRSSDIFLLPSRLEGMPKVSLEAAATGLPCVVFSNYQTPSVVHGVTGFQVGTTQEMVEALGRLIVDRSLRDQMGRHARTHAEQFSWDAIVPEWQKAYLEIAAQTSI